MSSTDPSLLSASPSLLPVVIVLAAGRGERFAASGGTIHKLSALLAGKTVREHVLDAVRASGLNYHVVEPDSARPGMGDSIAAGVGATPDAAGWLILPADLPLVQAGTLRAVAQALAYHAVVIPLHQGVRGHPVGFSPACRAGLLALQGEQGAAPVVRAQQALAAVGFLERDDAGIVTDVDTLDDLERAGQLLRARAQM